MTSSESGVSSSAKPVRSGGVKHKTPRTDREQQQQQSSPVPPRKNSSCSDSKDEDSILQSIASLPSILHSPHQVTLSCYIPSQAVGAVIGRRGSTIAQIQRMAQQQYGNVRVSIVGHDTVSENNTSTTESVPYTFTELDWSSPDWTPVVICGDPCAVLWSAQKLRDYAASGSSSSSSDSMDDVVLDVPLNRSHFPKLIGKRGMTLAALSADTNVRIMVPQRTLRIDLFQLEGELDNVKMCFEKIVLLLSSAKKTSTTKATSSSSTEENKVSASITVPTLPSQTKLRVVARKTETSIQKKRQQQGDDNSSCWLITVYGKDTEQVENAMGMLETWKAQNSNNTDATTAAAATKQTTTGASNNNNNNSNVTTTPPRRRPRPRNRNRPKSGKKGGDQTSSTTTTTPLQKSSSSPPPPAEESKAES